MSDDQHQNQLEQQYEHSSHDQPQVDQPRIDEQSHTESQVEQHPDEQVVVRRRLGRGLGALLGGSGPTNEPLEESALSHQGTDSKVPLRDLPLSAIKRNPNQPRKDFDTPSLKELASSIKEHGVLQPIIVREYQGHFQIVAGERRWLACQQAGLESIPCRIVDVIDKIACEFAIEENLKRQDLSDLEKAQAFKDYMTLFETSVEELAKQLSMSRSAVSNTVRLLDLPVPVKQLLQKGQISAGHARCLLALKPEQQLKMADRIVKQQLSVRKTEEEVRAITNPEPKTPKLAENTQANQQDVHIVSLQNQLRELLSAKVDIQLSGKDKGKILIHFENNDEFESILGRLRERLSNAA